MKHGWCGRARAVAAVSGLFGMALWVTAAQAADEVAKPVEGQVAAPVENEMTVKLEYTLTVDGQVVDSSEGRTPLSYVQGSGQVIPGLEKQLSGMHAGESKAVTVKPEEGYGAVDPQAVVTVRKDHLPPDLVPEVGMMLRGTGRDGQPFRARIQQVAGDNVTLDLNHPLAGKTLEFKVKVVEVSKAL